jgi:hypothetical protein
MTAGVRWKIDNRRLVDARVHAAAVGAVGDAAEMVLEEANRTAPIEEGVMIGSGGVDVDRAAGRASVFYDTPYAPRQHEDTRLRHDEGRRAKWLERTVLESRRRIAQVLAAGMKARIR